MKPLEQQLQFLDGLEAMASIVRGNLPHGDYLIDLAIKPNRKDDGNPAAWEVVAYVGRMTEESRPGGWAREIALSIQEWVGWGRVSILTPRSRREVFIASR